MILILKKQPVLSIQLDSNFLGFHHTYRTYDNTDKRDCENFEWMRSTDLAMPETGNYFLIQRKS